jgi:hypothetical protein
MILLKKYIYYVHHLLLNNELNLFKNLRVFVINLDINYNKINVRYKYF